VNLLLKRLPQLLDSGVSPEAAFGGTFHINETWAQLDGAYLAAEQGTVPDPLPCEIYCHSLTDPTILSPELQASGAHTLTVFGLHVPDRLITAENNEQMRAALQAAVVKSLNSVLAEPIEELLLTGDDGTPCIETSAATSSTAGSTGRSPRTTPRWTPPRGAGAWPRMIPGSCCAAPEHGAAAQ
jgi:phytoene dehydrogenase-like protein